MNPFLASLRTRLVLLVLLAEIPALALMFYATQAQRQFLIEEEEANLTRLTRLVALAYPVREETGRKADPDWLGEVARDLDLPAGAAVFVMNSRGVILSQFPDPERWVGRAMPDQPAVKAVLRRMQGTAEVPGFDGALLLYAFGPVLPLTETGLFISVGIPKETVFAAVDRASARGLLGLVLVGVLVLAVAWVGSDFFVFQRLDLAREAEERTRLILDTAHDAFISIDAGGRIVDWNRQAEETFGWPRQEAVGQSLAETIIPLPYRDEHGRGLKRFLATGEGAALNRRVEIQAQRRGGETFPIEMTIVPVRTGETYLFASFLRDVSARKRAEEALYRLASIVESSDDAIISTTLAGEILTWNAAAERIYGYTEEEALGRGLSFLVPSDRAAEPLGTLARLAHGERIENYETVCVRKDGTLIDVAVTTSPLRNADGAIVGASAISRDITERKRDHVKSDFIALVSHQLRTPVAELKGYIDNMLAGLTGPLTAKQAVYLREMQTTNSHNYHLITSLLDVSRIERGVISADMQPVGLEDIVTRAVRPHVERILAKGLRLTLPAEEAAVAILADEDKMVEALGNVVGNAVRYTEAGTIAIRIWTDDTYAYVEVADTGRGIAPDVLSKLFTKNQILSGEPTAEGGSGLGLYVAKAFMRLQRGDVTVTSLVGRGSAFVLKIPLDGGARGAGREVHVHRV